MVVLLLVEARKGISANQAKRTGGVSYKTVRVDGCPGEVCRYRNQL